MRVCVYGAGAIGGHLAVRLARGGAEVSVLARGPHLAAIQHDGLTVHTSEGQLHARVQASDDPRIQQQPRVGIDGLDRTRIVERRIERALAQLTRRVDGRS